MVRKVSYMMMSEQDYADILAQIHDLENKLYIAELERDMFKARSNSLFDALNRPAIKAAEEAGNNEFYDWCNEIADKYDKLDEIEWITDRAKFYNNGMCEYAKEHDLGSTCEEVERYRKYGDGCKHWYTTTLMKECDDEELEVAKTEGWSEIASHYGLSCVLPHAMYDIFERYFKDGWVSRKYEKLYDTFEEMEKECGSWKEFCR